MSTEEIKSKLLELAPSLNGNDRIKIAAALECSFSTVTRYLNGEVANRPYGIAIISEAQKIVDAKTVAA